MAPWGGPACSNVANIHLCAGPSIRICCQFGVHFPAAQPPSDRFRGRGSVPPAACSRVVSFAVAVYLILAGLVGLNGVYHVLK
jgi:hypothetical protein